MLVPDAKASDYPTHPAPGGREPGGDDIPLTSVGPLLPGQRMSWMGGASLQVKLALIVVPVMILALCMLLIVLMTSAAEDGLKALGTRATVTTDVQVQALSQPLWELNAPQITRIVDTLAQDPDIVGARLLDETGKFIHGFGRLEGSDILTVTRVVPHPVARDSVPLGQLTVAMSQVSLNETLRVQLLSAGAAIAVGAVLMIGAVFLSLQQLVFRPLRMMLRAIERIENREWPSVRWESHDQLGVVVSAFNRMVKTLRSNERELREAMHAAEAAARAKDEFLANVSHELRTPLNAILGFSEVLKSEMFGPLGSDRYRAYAGDVFTSGTHLLEIINDILDLSKVAAGKFELMEQPFDVDHTIDSCAQLMRERATSAKLALHTDVPAHLPQLFGDELRIKQVIINLLGNAIKFTMPGGQVWVAARGREDGGVDLIVGDTGIGMRPQDIPKALSAFGQIESVLSRSHQGTGLGLPLVQAFCEMHQAKLTIDSSPGVGTIVTVTFPGNRVRAVVS
ncbi:MAG: ATP-binding protein [Elstera sp.]